jgi:phosphate transport system permease protein
MKRPKWIIEHAIEGLFTLSGAITSLAILLIVLFLFGEGLGFFKHPAVEQGYCLAVNAQNTITTLQPQQIKRIFDAEITNWEEIGGKQEAIKVFRFEDIFSLYSDEELGEDYALLPEKIEEVIAANTSIIAFLPEQYLPIGNNAVKTVSVEAITVADFFLGEEWLPTATPVALMGVLPLIWGTLWVSFFAILLALPLGLGVAIYLSELASKRIRKIIKPVIELLAGIPSVVYGFFGLVVLVPLIQTSLHLPVGETALAGSLILAIMALPTIITLAEDAMYNTPKSMSEASLALGATHWQTIYRVIIPHAASGITAALILGIGRAIGETMAVLMVTGNAAVMPHSLFDPVRTIPATIAAELGEAPAGGAHYQSLFLLGCILFSITMITSIVAEVITKKQLNKGF